MRDKMDKIVDYADAVAVAAQLGRLDWASVLLALVGVILAVAGLVGYINFRYTSRKVAEEVAEKEAKEVAEKVAKGVAERITNEYIRKEMPQVIKSNVSMYFSEQQKNDDIGQIADDAEGGK